MRAPSPWQILLTTPPAVVRLKARRKTRGRAVYSLSLAEIAITSGLTLTRVEQIANQLDWTGVDIIEAHAFCTGCNYDPLSPADRNRQSAYERSCRKRNRTYRFLQRSPTWATELRPLILKVKEAATAGRSTSNGTAFPKSISMATRTG